VVADPTLYLFDGYNLLHAGDFGDVRELRDLLASFVALKGARGILVFDGAGSDERYGPLEVRYAPHADTLIERLAAEHRSTDLVCLVSSDAAVRGTSGPDVMKLSSRTFLGDIERPRAADEPRSSLADRVDAETLARLEQLRRGH
jgi:predicted RNA-binding protein with PIN domain